MRAIEPQFELIDIAQVPARDWTVGDLARAGIARQGEASGTAREYKNSGNEAKNWLKTKDIAFLATANCASFACKSAQIGR
jgi:hypothetical protein